MVKRVDDLGRGLLALALFSGVACDKPQAPAPPRAAPVAQVAPAPAAPPAPVVAAPSAQPAPAAVAAAPAPPRRRLPEVKFFTAPDSDASWLLTLTHQAIASLESVGHSSVVFKAHLVDGDVVALRVRTKQSPRGYLAELAAYRVAHVLRMDHVPPVGIRRITRDELRAKLGEQNAEEFEALNSRIAWDADGTAPCSLVPWISGLRDADLERTRTWSAWMTRDARVPAAKRKLADDLARTMLFDFLIANIDRFTGGNMKVDATGARLVTRDHNLAFVTPVPPVHARALQERLAKIERWPNGFRELVSSIDEATWRRLLGARDADAGEALLTPAQMDAFIERSRSL